MTPQRHKRFLFDIIKNLPKISLTFPWLQCVQTVARAKRMRISFFFIFPYELSLARINGKHVLKIVSSGDTKKNEKELTFLMTHDNFSLSHTTNGNWRCHQDSLSINFPFFNKSVCRLARRTFDSRCVIHLAFNDRCLQTKVYSTDGCHWWTRYVSLISYRLKSTRINLFNMKKSLPSRLTGHSDVFLHHLHHSFISYFSATGQSLAWELAWLVIAPL